MSKQFYQVLVFDYQPSRDKNTDGVLIDSWFTKSNSIGLVRQEVFDKYSGAFSRTILLEKPTENGFYVKILVVDESIYNHEKEEIDDFCFCCGTRIKGRKASFPSTIISFGSSYTDSYDEDFFDEDTLKFQSARTPNRFSMIQRRGGLENTKKKDMRCSDRRWIFLVVRLSTSSSQGRRENDEWNFGLLVYLRGTLSSRLYGSGQNKGSSREREEGR